MVIFDFYCFLKYCSFVCIGEAEQSVLPSGTQWSFEIPNSLVGDSYISTSNGEGGNVKKVADFALKIPIYAQPSFEILVSLVNDSYIPTGNSEAENVQKIIDFELMSSISAVKMVSTQTGMKHWQTLPRTWRNEHKFIYHGHWIQTISHVMDEG